MKLSEIRKCDFCASPVAGNTRDGKAIDFRRLVLEHMILDPRAIQERIGLTMMLGGSEALADVMGSDRDVAVAAFRTELLVCSPCWLERFEALHELGKKGKSLPTPEAELAIARARR